MSGDEIINGLQEAIGGDLISREAACEAAEVYPEDGVIGEQSYWFAMGAMAAREALRALPAAPEAGEAALPLIADYLRAPHMDAKREIDRRAQEWIDGNPDPWVNALSAERDTLRARLAEVEAERDAALAQVAAAFEAAAQWLIDAGLAGDAPEDPLASCIRALTPADATAALERIIAERVQAATAALLQTAQD